MALARCCFAISLGLIFHSVISEKQENDISLVNSDDSALTEGRKILFDYQIKGIK